MGKGPAAYFTSGWDLFDFLVTVISVTGLLGEFFNDEFYFVIVLRPFTLLRLFKMKTRYRDVLGTLFVLFTRLVSLAIVIILVYYVYAIIGMEIFLNTDLRNCCKNSSVEDSFAYDFNSTNKNQYYYMNNFDNILVSGVTLFELTVVNNWFIIMEGYAKHVGEWTRLYFMSFYIVMMVVMNIVVAFILEQFLFRMQYIRTMDVDDMDDHARHTVHITISEEEQAMCDHGYNRLTGDHLINQAKSCDIPTPYLYKGERFRSKEDYSLRMFSDEVKTWIEEDHHNREEVIANMEVLRERRRHIHSINANDESDRPIFFHSTAADMESPNLQNSFA